MTIIDRLYSIRKSTKLTQKHFSDKVGVSQRAQMMKAAILAVRSFAMIRKIEIDEDREAKLIVLLVEYFEKGGKRQDKFVENILETSTNER